MSNQDVLQTIYSNTQKINMNISILGRLISFIGTPRENLELNTKIHDLREYINSIIKDNNNFFRTYKRFDDILENNQYNKLKNEFKTSLEYFQVLNQKYINSKKISEDMKHTGDIKHINESTKLINDESDQKLISYSSSSPSPSSMINQTVIDNTQTILEREQDIKNIETNMAEINEIYRDINRHIIDQGYTLDTIESNMAFTDNTVINSVKELKTAKRYQSGSRKKMCYLLVIVVAVLIILTGILLIKYK